MRRGSCFSPFYYFVTAWLSPNLPQRINDYWFYIKQVVCHSLLRAKISPHHVWLSHTIGCPDSAVSHELHQTHPPMCRGVSCFPV